MVPPHPTIFSREPFRAPLSEDNVAGDHVLAACLLCSETLSGAVARCLVGAATLGSVGGITDLGEARYGGRLFSREGKRRRGGV